MKLSDRQQPLRGEGCGRADRPGSYAHSDFLYPRPPRSVYWSLPVVDLNQYLSETEYAAQQILAAIWHEYDAIVALAERVTVLEAQVAAEYRNASVIMNDAETPDDVMLGVGRHWENYFGPDRERSALSDQLAALQSAREAREFALGTLAGSLLQIAAQGLSVAFGSHANWPPGRVVGTQSLSDVIKGARNQATHWEEGNFRPATEQVFSQLTQDFGADFSNYRSKNLAMLVIGQIGWISYDAYLTDMKALV